MKQQQQRGGQTAATERIGCLLFSKNVQMKLNNLNSADECPQTSRLLDSLIEPAECFCSEDDSAALIVCSFQSFIHILSVCVFPSHVSLRSSPFIPRFCVEAAAGGITRPTGRTGEHGRLSALIGPFSFYSSDFFPLSFSPLSSLLTHTHLGASAGITEVL